MREFIRKVEPTIIEKGWGHEEVVVNDEINGYCGKLLFFKKAGHRGSLHFHIEKKEHFRVGLGKFRIEFIDPLNAKNYSLEVGAGDIVEIPRGHCHRIVCLEEGFIIEFSTPDRASDSYRVVKGDSQS